MTLWLIIKKHLRDILVQVRRIAKSRLPVNINSESDITEYGSPGYHIFFGYHDVTPFNVGDKLLLATRCPANSMFETTRGSLELGIYDTNLRESVFVPFTTTSTWCWQQGCRLQWYPNDSKSHVFFNNSDGIRHTSCIFDIEACEVVKSFDRALYGISPDGRFGVSLNFARLHRLRPGYGYDNLPDTTTNQLSPSDDGLWLLDLVTGDSQFILSLHEIAAFETELSMAHATHYFNHVLWSPGGTKFFFLHLWLTPDGKRHSRACIWNKQSESFSLLGPHNIVSHHCWVDDESIVVFAREPKTGMRYHLYNLEIGSVGGVGINVLREDGHPSMSPTCADLMITDTYPNRIGEQSLLLYNFTNETCSVVAELYSPTKFGGEVRCDLHPRWNNAGNMVCVDSAHSGERRLCVLNVENLANSLIN